MTAIIKSLTKAATQVSNLTDAGMSPQDAMIKVASDNRLQPEAIRRVAHVVNRTAAISQRLASDHLEDKLATFELIDPDQVIASLYQSSQSTPSQKVANRPETSVQARIVKQLTAPLVSSKVADAPLPQSVDLSSHSTAGLYDGLRGPALSREVARLENQRREAVAKLASIERDITIQFDSVVNKIASLVPRAQVELVDHSRVFFEERNPVAAEIVFHAANQLSTEVQAKLAVSPEVPDVWCRALQQSDFVHTVEKLAAFIQGLDELEEPHRAKYADAVARLELIESSLDDSGQVSRRGISSRGSFADLDKQWLETKTADLMGLVGLGVGASARKQPPAGKPTKEDQYLLQLRNPQHSAALSATRTRAALQTLMADDPVIKGYKPEEVIKAFNELSQYSPRAAEHTASLRAGLRMALQNNQSLFDLEQLRKSERTQKV